MTYGCPYKGSKNKIAKEIVEILPVGERLVDLFCGGGAIAHCAALSGKYAEVLANDLSDSVDMLEKAIRGDYANERRVITREDFHRLKDFDPYVAYCWSFGNNGCHYLWDERNEALKIPAIRLIFGESLEERYTAYIQFVGAVQRLVADIRREDTLKLQWVEEAKEWREQHKAQGLQEKNRLKWELGMKRTQTMAPLVMYFREAYQQSGLTAKQVADILGSQMGSHYFTNGSQWSLPTAEYYAKLQKVMPALKVQYEALKVQYEALKVQYEALKVQYDYLLKGRTDNEMTLQSLQSLQSLQRLQRLQSLQRLQRLPIKTSRQDYRNVELKKSDIVYCDIPYKNTDQYKVGDFNHEEFYEWCRRQEATIIVSEYAMPDDFVCIWAKNKMCRFSASKATKTVEKLFVPKHQADRWEHRLSQELIQGELFVA